MFLSPWAIPSQVPVFQWSPRAPNHPTLHFPHFIHFLYLPQCFALDYVSFTLFSSSHHPLNRSSEGGWGEVGGGASGRGQLGRMLRLQLLCFLSCLVAAVSLSLSLLEAYFSIYKYIKKQVKLGCIKLTLLSKFKYLYILYECNKGT